ncbi:MAG: hypothetical protein ACJ07L_05720 [Opitutales bacterium]
MLHPIPFHDSEKLPRLGIALIPVLPLTALLFGPIRYLDASPHVPIILACTVAGLVALQLGYN